MVFLFLNVELRLKKYMNRDLFRFWWRKFQPIENKKNYIVPVQNWYCMRFTSLFAIRIHYKKQ